jgi:ribulose-phosphate 3-epimerase
MNRGTNREYHQARSVLATHITPAILPTDFHDLYSKIYKVTSLVDWVQIDVLDGSYAPNKTWPYTEGGESNDIFTKIVKQDEPMPFWDEVNFEVDLLVKNPVFEVDRWIAAGAMRLVVHMDSIELPAFVELAQRIKEKGIELIVGFSVDSSVEKLVSYIQALGDTKDSKIVNCVQCMGIKKIGFQAQPFDVAVLENIRKIKEALPYIFVSVDGGVNEATVKSLIEAGADRLIVGSALYTSDSIQDALVSLSKFFDK